MSGVPSDQGSRTKPTFATTPSTTWRLLTGFFALLGTVGSVASISSFLDQHPLTSFVPKYSIILELNFRLAGTVAVFFATIGLAAVRNLRLKEHLRMRGGIYDMFPTMVLGFRVYGITAVLSVMAFAYNLVDSWAPPLYGLYCLALVVWNNMSSLKYSSSAGRIFRACCDLLIPIGFLLTSSRTDVEHFAPFFLMLVVPIAVSAKFFKRGESRVGFGVALTVPMLACMFANAGNFHKGLGDAWIFEIVYLLVYFMPIVEREKLGTVYDVLSDFSDVLLGPAPSDRLRDLLGRTAAELHYEHLVVLGFRSTTEGKEAALAIQYSRAGDHIENYVSESSLQWQPLVGNRLPDIVQRSASKLSAYRTECVGSSEALKSELLSLRMIRDSELTRTQDLVSFAVQSLVVAPNMQWAMLAINKTSPNRLHIVTPTTRDLLVLHSAVRLMASTVLVTLSPTAHTVLVAPRSISQPPNVPLPPR